MNNPNILDYTTLTRATDISCEVCIIGSGAGGATLAAQLCAQGIDVVMIEAGSNRYAKHFNMNEAQAFNTLYQEGGLRSTEDLGIAILQGATLGGSTTINWTTCFRTPDRILDIWQNKYGLRALSPENMAPYFAAIEKQLNINPWPEEAANNNNKVIAKGAKALGWEYGVLRRNVKGCANSGYCGMGCPIDAKQGMLVTTIPQALEAGMRLLCNTRAIRIETSTTRAERLRAEVINPQTKKTTGIPINIKAKVFVSSCGAINGPALFLRSGLDDKNLVGKRTFLHPVIGLAAQFAKPINGFYGAPQSLSSHQFIDRGANKIGYFIEVAPTHPVLSSTAASSFGASQQDFMKNLAHLSFLIAIHADGIHPQDQGGSVTLSKSGNPIVRYIPGEPLKEAFAHAHRSLAQLGLAAGAEVCHTLHTRGLQIRTKDDIDQLSTREYGTLRHGIFSAHQMGGLPMGADPNQSIVNPQHRHHNIKNLFVVDGSVFPTALGVNPSQTIYSLALRAAPFIKDAVRT